MSLHSAQRQVEAFHRAMGLPIGQFPALVNVKLRADLIIEEANETTMALVNDDFVAAIDGLCDLIYVCLGAAVTWGIDLEPFWMEVQMSNMAKLGGPIRADGKQLKPEGWRPPRIAEILAMQIEYVTPVTIASFDEGDLFDPELGGEA